MMISRLPRGLATGRRRAFAVEVLYLPAAVALTFLLGVPLLQAQMGQQPNIPGGREVNADLLILRSGATVRGKIKVCNIDLCRVDGKSYPREEIAWIGLAPASSTPPHVVDPSEDEVHLVDQSVHKGHLVGISLGEVDIETGSWDRPEVDWIHLAGAVVAPPSSGVINGQEVTPPGAGKSGGEGEEKSGGDEPGSHDPPPPPPPPPSRTPPPPSRTSPAKQGGLWSGEIHIHFRVADDKGSIDQKTDVAAHLREVRYPLLRPSDGKSYGTVVHLYPEGTEIRTKYEADTPGQSEGVHCQGEGTLTLTFGPDDPGHGHGSVIWINNTAADTTPWIGFPITRHTPRYSVSLSTLPSDKFTVNCLAWRINGGRREEFPSSQEEAYYLAGFGRSPLGCPEFLAHVCDPQFRTIEGENGRMFGAYHNQWEESDFHNDLEVRWSLCRDDVPCAAAPPEPEKKPCGGTANDDALLDACRDQEGALIKLLMKKWTAYTADGAKAAAHQSDFQKAIGACVAWDTTELVLEALLAADVPAAGLSAEEAAEVTEFKESLERINDLMKAVTSGDPLEVLGVPQVKDLMTSLEAVKKFFEVFPVLDHGAAEQFLAQLDECNAPLSSELRTSAQTYLLDMQRALEELNDYHKVGNDLDKKADECGNLQLKAYQACLENARCNGTPESDCDSRKPEGK